MKIAFFTENFLPKVDGIVTRLTKTVRHLVEAGDEVVVFCPEGCPDEYMGAQLIGVPAMPLPLYPELKLLSSLSNILAFACSSAARLEMARKLR